MGIKKLLTILLPIGLGLFVGLFILPYQFSSQKPLSVNQLDGQYNPIDERGEFLGKPVASKILASTSSPKNVLGSTSASKRIEVDLTNQRLYAFEGDNKVYDFAISSGKWGKTPTGTFNIWIKLRYTKMEGGNKALGTYYYLPNVPYTMFFASSEVPSWRGFGIHGTYWHNNFGHPMSHGCVNMKTEEVAQLYYWADPALGDKPSIKATNENQGTQVVIYGVAPNS